MFRLPFRVMSNARREAAETLRRIVAALDLAPTLVVYLHGLADGLELRARARRSRA